MYLFVFYFYMFVIFYYFFVFFCFFVFLIYFYGCFVFDSFYDGWNISSNCHRLFNKFILKLILLYILISPSHASIPQISFVESFP